MALDRKSTRLNSSHLVISYAVFCLKKNKKHKIKILGKVLAYQQIQHSTLVRGVRRAGPPLVRCPPLCPLSLIVFVFFFFFNDTATTEIYTFPYTTLFRS